MGLNQLFIKIKYILYIINQSKNLIYPKNIIFSFNMKEDFSRGTAIFPSTKEMLTDWKPHLVVLIVLAFFSWYYFIFRGFAISGGMIDSILAFSATIILTLSFCLGPLSRFLRFIRKDLVYRKTFGLWGYGLVVLHVILAHTLMIYEEGTVNIADVSSYSVAVIAFVVFTVMAITSTNKWLTMLGYDNWKTLQRTGYLALIFMILHVILLGQGVYLNRLTGQIAIGFVLIVILLRIITLILNVERKHPGLIEKINGKSSKK